MAQLLSSSSSSSSSLKPKGTFDESKDNGFEGGLAAEKEEEKRPSPDGFKRQRIRPSATAVQAAAIRLPNLDLARKRSRCSQQRSSRVRAKGNSDPPKRGALMTPTRKQRIAQSNTTTTAAAAEAATDAAAAAAPAAKCDAELEDMVGRRFCDSSDDEE